MCLSLLGTWSGPGWIAGKSTLLQVCLSGENCMQDLGLTCYRSPGAHLDPIHDSLRGTVLERARLGK